MRHGANQIVAIMSGNCTPKYFMEYLTCNKLNVFHTWKRITFLCSSPNFKNTRQKIRWCRSGSPNKKRVMMAYHVFMNVGKWVWCRFLLWTTNQIWRAVNALPLYGYQFPRNLTKRLNCGILRIDYVQIFCTSFRHCSNINCRAQTSTEIIVVYPYWIKNTSNSSHV